MLEEIKKIRSERKELRGFGITIGIILFVLGGYLWWRGNDSYLIIFIISGVFLFFGLLFPFILLPVHKVWMTLAILIGFIMTRVILSFLFYFLISPLSLVSRLFGRKFLDLGFIPGENSYWIYRSQKPFSKESYEKQF